MNLALTILFFWLGCAALYVAFHPLLLEGNDTGSAKDVIASLQKKIAAQDSAYSTTVTS